MFYYHLVMKEDTKMPRKGISPVSALELAMSCSRCPDPVGNSRIGCSCPVVGETGWY